MAKVLLVEDDNNLREIYQARLAAEGYDIVAAQNGEEALVAAKQNKPDLIISDVMMPRISGFEMLDILRNTDELKDTKVIMLTALGQAEDQARADNLGADKYLVKSQVTLEDIVNAAKSLLGETGTQSPATDNVAAENVAAATPDPIPASVETAPILAETPPPAVEQPIQPAPEPSPVSDPVEAAPPLEAAVPASIVPQPDTTVVVPPAPANPTPPTVTVAPVGPATPASTSDDIVATKGTVASPVASDLKPAVSIPEPASVAQVTPTDSGSATPSDTTTASAASQPTESEEAAMKAQIEEFAHQAESAPVEAVPTPEVTSNDQAIASAVEELNGVTESAPAEPTELAAPTTEVSTPATTPEPVSETPPAPAVTSLGGTKVIQPLNDRATTGPNLDELLAQEEAKEAADKPVDVPTLGVQTAPNTPPTSGGVDPNSIAL